MHFGFRQLEADKDTVLRIAGLGGNRVRQSGVPPAYPPCTAALSGLTKVTIEYILRAIVLADALPAIEAIAEDEHGDVVLLQLYNQEKGLLKDGGLTEGTVILVKEPYLKLVSDEDWGIRVGHLSDVKFLSEYEPLIPVAWRRTGAEAHISAQDWNRKGDNWLSAMATITVLSSGSYSKALESSPTAEEAITIRLDRAVSCLGAHEFEAALHDLDIQPTPDAAEQALLRKSEALYYLQRYKESFEVHRIRVGKFSGNRDAEAESNRVRARLNEQRTGSYEFRKMQREAKERRPPFLDHVTYVGPVAICTTASHGRGLLTTQAVKASDLLLCEKAFAHAPYDSNDAKRGLPMLISPQTNVMTLGTQEDLITPTTQKIYKNPSLGADFTTHYHGSYQSVDVLEVDSKLVVDTFLIEQTVSLSCFGCPLSSRTSHIDLVGKGEDTDKPFHSSGLWRLALYINHSCYCITRRSFIGDMMIVHAIQNIRVNTELTFWYKSPLEGTPNGDAMDLAHWGFRCSCIICQDNAGTDDMTLENRKGLVASLDAFLDFLRSGKFDPAGIVSLLSWLEETLLPPSLRIPRLAIWSYYRSPSLLYTRENQPRKAIESGLKALESLGYIIQGGQLPHPQNNVNRIRLVVRKWGLVADTLVGCWMNLAFSYRDLAPAHAIQAGNYAWITYRMCIGEDETFNDTYSRDSDEPGGLSPKDL
ncbi:hypothetical protein BDW71DRAFT_197864 [Aspergillus fruticulosus]